MPSKKKERGKARRAKAGSAPNGGENAQRQAHATANDSQLAVLTTQQEKVQTRRLLARLKRNSSATEDEGDCFHGCGPPPSTGATVLGSVETLIGALFEETRIYRAYYTGRRAEFSEGIPITILRTVCNENGGGWVMAFLASVGADCLLRKMGDIDMAFVAALSIMKLEFRLSMMLSSELTETMRDLIENTERETHKFFSRRIPCQCLDERYKQLKKSTPKMGSCDGCKETKLYKELMLCTRCHSTQYCSRKCQAADWPLHKGRCNEVASVGKQMDDAHLSDAQGR